jgi:hypothetical protein
MHDNIIKLVTSIVGTKHAVIERRWNTRTTIGYRVADLGAVAEGAVTAVRIIGRVYDYVVKLVTRIVGAEDAVIEIRRAAWSATG